MIHHILTVDPIPQEATTLWTVCGLQAAMREPRTGETWWTHLALPPSKVAVWRQRWETAGDPVCPGCLEGDGKGDSLERRDCTQNEGRL
jgi:hypothetical protein